MRELLLGKGLRADAGAIESYLWMQRHIWKESEARTRRRFRTRFGRAPARYNHAPAPLRFERLPRGTQAERPEPEIPDEVTLSGIRQHAPADKTRSCTCGQQFEGVFMTDHILYPESSAQCRADTGNAPLRKSEVCAALGISERTLNNLVARKEFPPGVRIGKWAYWTQKALDNYRARAFTMQENWTPMTPGRGRLR